MDTLDLPFVDFSEVEGCFVANSCPLKIGFDSLTVFCCAIASQARGIDF